MMLLRRDLHWPSLVILTSGLLSVGPVGILAQTTTASCLSDFNFLFNSFNQSPCLLSAYLQGACNGGQFTVSALPPKTHYTGPFADEQNPCQCSSVTYNAVSACGICQNHTFISWSTWNTNCSTIYPAVFPPGVPAGTAIPQWAFQDVTTSGAFNVTLAQSVGDNPESVATIVQSTASSLPSTSIQVASLTPSPSATTSTTSTGSNTNAGAIAGGVVGGVVGVALIAGVIVFFVMKKKRSQIPPSAQFASGQTLPPSATYTDTTPFAAQMAQPRLYDPSDPSTFPASPPPTTIATGSSQDALSSPYYSTSSVRPGGHYGGMPEI